MYEHRRNAYTRPKEAASCAICFRRAGALVQVSTGDHEDLFHRACLDDTDPRRKVKEEPLPGAEGSQEPAKEFGDTDFNPLW